MTSGSMEKQDQEKITSVISGVSAEHKRMKYVSLFTLTIQNACLGLSMRYSRTRPGDMFIASAAVLMAEVTKLITCLFLVFKEEGHNFSAWKHALHSNIVKQPMDTLKVGVPSMVYTLQNNVLYVAATHLDVGTYQVTYQLKILTTAMFAVIMLKRQLRGLQWLSLVILLIGVALVQLSQSSDSSSSTGVEQNRLLGFGAAVFATLLSGFAGIWFEKILKGSDVSVWMRNVQLSLLSLPFATLTCFLNDYSEISSKGLFFGFNGFIWFVVAQQAFGGLITAVVVKYADNILKGFATSLAIIISCIVSVYLFSFVLTLQFAMGTFFVIASVFMYGYKPPEPKPISNVTV